MKNKWKAGKSLFDKRAKCFMLYVMVSRCVVDTREMYPKPRYIADENLLVFLLQQKPFTIVDGRQRTCEFIHKQS